MYSNKQLTDLIDSIGQLRLGSSIDGLENYLLAHPRQADMDKLMQIKADYQLMADYWQRGAADPERDRVYMQLLRRLYVLAANMLMHEQLKADTYWSDLYHRPRESRKDWSMTAVRTLLEGYVADAALLELEPPHTRQAKSKELHSRHLQLMQQLFQYILTTRLWSDAVADAFIDLLLSPTVDTIDQQLIVSAITLSAMNAFGINKFKVLTSVYRQTNDLRVKERALVGWVLTLDERKARLYPEMGLTVRQLCDDEACRSELTELQMQLYYCMDAERDQQTIVKDIMPDIMKGSNLALKNRQLVETDEDTLEDILHPEAAEQRMEKMEQGMQRMMDMQQRGADIYFAGFSQVKRHPFYNDLSNWFMPFYTAHPGISDIWEKAKDSNLMRLVDTSGAFCDSDMYSFVLVYHQMRSMMSEKMLELIDSGDASPMPIGGEIGAEERRSPAYVRRMYLHDLYRFYRLYDRRSEYRNPFEDRRYYLFTANPLVADTLMNGCLTEIGVFLIKRKRYDDAKRVLQQVGEQHCDNAYAIMMGRLMLRSPLDYASASAYFEKALEQKPEDESARAGLARSLFLVGQYRQALGIYESLLEAQPDNKAYMLSAAICLSNLQCHEEALKHLFKLNYLYPDDIHVKRALAWSLVEDGKLQQAANCYADLLAQEEPQADDFLHSALCQWFTGDVAKAIALFREYQDRAGEAACLDEVLLEKEYELIRRQDIGDIEIRMMLDAAGG